VLISLPLTLAMGDSLGETEEALAGGAGLEVTVDLASRHQELARGLADGSLGIGLSAPLGGTGEQERRQVFGFARHGKGPADSWGSIFGGVLDHHANAGFALNQTTATLSTKATATCAGICEPAVGELFTVSFIWTPVREAFVVAVTSFADRASSKPSVLLTELPAAGKLLGNSVAELRLEIVALSPTAAVEIDGLAMGMSLVDAATAGRPVTGATVATTYLQDNAPRVAFSSAVLPPTALVEDAGAVFPAGASAAQLAAGGCALMLHVPGAAVGADRELTPLLAVPVGRKHAISRSSAYRFRTTVKASSAVAAGAGPELLVGLADGSDAGAHFVGFVRGPRDGASAGLAAAGLLGRELRATDAVALEASAAYESSSFTLDVVFGADTETIISLLHPTTGALLATSTLSPGSFALNVHEQLYLVLGGAVSTEDAGIITLSALSQALERVTIGCDGVANSGLVVDRCDVCGGSDTCVGCDGRVHSGKTVDACGVCGGDGTSCVDCAGVVNGSSVIDSCGVCGGQDACDAAAGSNSGAARHRAGVELRAAEAAGRLGSVSAEALAKRAVESGGSFVPKDVHYSSQVDCNGVPHVDGGRAVFDSCGVCGGSDECIGCDGLPFSDAVYDSCGVCGGDDSSCCVNYADVPDTLWNFLLLPLTVDGLIEKLQLSQDTLGHLIDLLPSVDNLTVDAIADLQLGRMAQFNRVFLDDCLQDFGSSSVGLSHVIAEDALAEGALHSHIYGASHGDIIADLAAARAMLE
jgi:hypothetical protein